MEQSGTQRLTHNGSLRVYTFKIYKLVLSRDQAPEIFSLNFMGTLEQSELDSISTCVMAVYAGTFKLVINLALSNSKQLIYTAH